MCEYVWSSDYPTEPGWYWFYGRKYGEDKHSMGTVTVFSVQTGAVRVLDGQFMWEQDKHKGVFSRIDEPVISPEIAGGEFKSSPVVITREDTI